MHLKERAKMADATDAYRDLQEEEEADEAAADGTGADGTGASGGAAGAVKVLENVESDSEDEKEDASAKKKV